jgi:hypothetical protein
MSTKLAGLQEQLAILMGGHAHTDGAQLLHSEAAGAAAADPALASPASAWAGRKALLLSAAVRATPPPAFEDEV